MNSSIGNTYLSIEHLRLGAQSVTFRDQAVHLLPPLQHRLNSLMQHVLNFVHFLLELSYSVSLFWVLELLDILAELGEGEWI